jgi:hypothetical protein
MNVAHYYRKKTASDPRDSTLAMNGKPCSNLQNTRCSGDLDDILVDLQPVFHIRERRE